MRLIRYLHEGSEKTGILEGDTVHEIEGGILGKHRKNGRTAKLSDLKILAPCEPSKVVCVGRNYVEHAKELNNPIPKEPLLFLKPSTSIIATDEAVIYPPQTSNLHHEGELAIVIGRRAKDVGEDDALSYVLGYTCLNDVTARDLQRSDVQFTRGKGFDTFCPIGPWIETEIDPSDLKITTRLNGQVKQDSRTSFFIFKIPYLISYISCIMTLLPGDVIATGTPEGVGPMQKGDVVEIEIEDIGVLRNTVK